MTIPQPPQSSQPEPPTESVLTLKYNYGEYEIIVGEDDIGEYNITLNEDYIKYAGRSRLGLFALFNIREYLDRCFEDRIVKIHRNQSNDGNYSMGIPLMFSKRAEIVELKRVQLSEKELTEITIKKLKDKIERLEKQIGKPAVKQPDTGIHYFKITVDHNKYKMETDVDFTVFKEYLLKKSEHIFSDWGADFTYVLHDKIEKTTGYDELTEVLLLDYRSGRWAFWLHGIFDFLCDQSYFIESVRTNVHRTGIRGFISMGVFEENSLLITFYHCLDKQMNNIYHCSGTRFERSREVGVGGKNTYITYK